MALVLTAALCLALAACGFSDNCTFVSKVENTGAHEWTMEYDEFSGVKYWKFVVEPGTTLHLSIEMEHESGKLAMAVIDKDENELLTLNQEESDMVASRYFIEGTYYVRLTAEKHVGATRVAFTQAQPGD